MIFSAFYSVGFSLHQQNALVFSLSLLGVSLPELNSISFGPILLLHLLLLLLLHLTSPEPISSFPHWLLIQRSHIEACVLLLFNYCTLVVELYFLFLSRCCLSAFLYSFGYLPCFIFRVYVCYLDYFVIVRENAIDFNIEKKSIDLHRFVHVSNLFFVGVVFVRHSLSMVFIRNVCFTSIW